jgi:hypothetical protein
LPASPGAWCAGPRVRFFSCRLFVGHGWASEKSCTSGSRPGGQPRSALATNTGRRGPT